MNLNYQWSICIFFVIYNSINVKINYHQKEEMYISPSIIFIIANLIFAYSLYTNDLLVLMISCLINIFYSLINIGQYIYYNKYYKNRIIYHRIT